MKLRKPPPKLLVNLEKLPLSLCGFCGSEEGCEARDAGCAKYSRNKSSQISFAPEARLRGEVVEQQDAYRANGQRV